MGKSHMTSRDQYQSGGFKKCARNGCSNSANYALTIIYLNKIGWFCKLCMHELTRDGLVLEKST
jgi:hypothetical protein